MRQGAARRAMGIAGLALLLGLATQFLLPPATGVLLARLLREEVGAEGSVRVQVASFPAVELLVGRIDRLQVEARAVRLDAVRVDTLLVTVRDLRLDMPSLLAGDVSRRHQGETRARLVVTEEALNEYLWGQVDPSRRFLIRLEPAGASLEGSLFGEALPVRVEGEFLLQDPTHIRFEPQRISVREAELPQALLRLLGEELVIPVGLEELPLPIGLEELSLGDGWLVATGSSQALEGREAEGGGA